MKEQYSGNNPKLTMIHDREGIHDLQQQLHRADQAYKSSPAQQNQESSGSAVYMTTPQSYRSSMSQHWRASNPSFDDPIAHDEAGRVGEGSPNMMVSPLNRSVEKLKEVKSDMQENRDDKKMGVKRYNKKVGRLNKKITRKGGEVPGNSPAEMHKGKAHGEPGERHKGWQKMPDPSKKNSTTEDLRKEKPRQKMQDPSKKSVEKDIPRQKMQDPSKKKNLNTNEEIIARRISKNKNSETSSKETSQKETETSRTLRKKEEKESTLKASKAALESKSTFRKGSKGKAAGDKQRERRAAEVKSGERDEMGYQS